MFSLIIKPIFCDTDALGHISNTIIPNWFESARDPLFRYFSPDLDPQKWQLILARYDIEFLAELHYGENVEIKTSLAKIGRSSIHVHQEVWQQNKCAVKGTTIMVHFDYQLRKSVPLPASIKEKLQEHLITPN
ncbi:MAG: acyl-CoA thioesterase [Gammaproteobacteria bacterium]|nr:acyl-CoA thioesterase [Gammaproteobacteria bacterium]